jgi:hypothetical protein
MTCACLTIKGILCKRKNAFKSKYCTFHHNRIHNIVRPPEIRIDVADRTGLCTKYTNKGLICKNKETIKNCGYCYRHIDKKIQNSNEVCKKDIKSSEFKNIQKCTKYTNKGLMCRNKEAMKDCGYCHCHSENV